MTAQHINIIVNFTLKPFQPSSSTSNQENTNCCNKTKHLSNINVHYSIEISF